MGQSTQQNSQKTHALIELLIERQVLQFGEFTLKSGRISPYFFNLGALDTGSALNHLAQSYADTVVAMDAAPDVLFGPAYKGIPIATASAVALAARGTDLGVAYNRKEAKTHGEGGNLVGASVRGRRVLLVDDVLTAGTALREALSLVSAAGGSVVGVIIALDRQELVDGAMTAVQSLAQEFGQGARPLPVRSLLCLEDVMSYLAKQDGVHTLEPEIRARMADYQAQYCTVA